jgi:Ran GTPase-activating protein (RanGAP) involved in mRNA processing and transport
MTASRNIQVGFSSAVVAASFRRSDRRTKLVIVRLLDTFLDVRRDRVDDVLQFLVTILLGMSKPSPKVSFDVHLVIAQGTCVA